MAKLMVDLQRGLIEVEGDEEFVERVYADVRETMVGQLKAPPISAISDDEETVTKQDKKVARKRPKSGGPSCASRILEAQAEGFFKELKSTADIVGKLSERGANYQANQVAAALIDLVKRGLLRRIKRDGSWAYQNP